MESNFKKETSKESNSNKKGRAFEIIAIVISLVISVFGFIRDLQNIYASPEFKHVPIVTIHSQIKYGYTNYYTMLINGAVYNPGEKPLFPMQYSIEIKGFDTLISIPSSAITPEFLKTIEDKTINNLNGIIEKDLRKVYRINPDDAVYGVLLFFIKDYLSGDFEDEKIKYRIVALDIDNKKYYSEYRPIKDGMPLNFFDEPKLNILLRDTTKNPFER